MHKYKYPKNRIIFLKKNLSNMIVRSKRAMISKMPKYKLAIFDMDQTLFHETIYPNVKSILRTLKNANVRMAIASFNEHAKWLCDRYDISKYFDIIEEGYCSGTQDVPGKMNHINNIKKYYTNTDQSMMESDMIFFDDDPQNILDIKENTFITCVKVDPSIGIKKNIIELII